MDKQVDPETPQARTRLTLQRGNFYFGMGFVLLAGLLLVVGLGVLGITSLGVFTVSTAMAMIAIAIALIGLVSFFTLTTLRRTLGLLSHHETTLADQAKQHADLAAKVQAQWRIEQAIRDRNQDADVASVSARQDASFLERQGRLERARVARAGRRAANPNVNPFDGGQVHPVRDIEGVGEHYGKLLDGMELGDTKRLWEADSNYVAGALKITPAVVEAWQSMAELMAVAGIGKQYAELLVRSGVASVDKLRAETPQRLVARIHRLQKHQGIRIQGNTIGIKIVGSWIRAAKVHHGVVPLVATVGPLGRGA